MKGVHWNRNIHNHIKTFNVNCFTQQHECSSQTLKQEHRGRKTHCLSRGELLFRILWHPPGPQVYPDCLLVSVKNWKDIYSCISIFKKAIKLTFLMRRQCHLDQVQLPGNVLYNLVASTHRREMHCPCRHYKNDRTYHEPHSCLIAKSEV